LSFNSGYGSAAVAYGCRAWVNFNGTTSPGTIRASGNVSIVTRNSTGVFTVNLTTAMSDVNYSTSASGGADASQNFIKAWPLTTSTVEVRGYGTADHGLRNDSVMTVQIFR
jgi:hypothetical protein